MSSEKLILIGGPPGSGKSTVAETLSKAKDMEHLSMGSYLRLIGRQAIRSVYYEELAMQQQALTQSARLPRELVLKILEEYLLEKKKKPTVLVDGYPRIEDQVGPFFDLLERVGVEPVVHVHLSVPEGIAIERIVGRGTREGESNTDAQFARRRVESHTQAYPPTLRAIERYIPVHEVDASADLEIVARDAIEIIDRHVAL